MNILIININRLGMTRNLVNDLVLQTAPYKLRLVDQNSSEKGTREYFETVKKYLNAEIIYNDVNIDVNQLWNKFHLETNSPYLCFLNNDLRIPSNFVKDTVEVFEKESTVGCVLHSTNHPDYQSITPLNYVVLEEKLTQGWAFAFRREAYKIIPDDVQFFGGDDLLFTNLYRSGWKTAMILSSPITHFYAKSRKYYKGNREENRLNMMKYNCERYSYRSKYTRRFPNENMKGENN